MAAPASASPQIDRVILIVLDSAGCGASPDAASYGDVGSDTIGNTARAVGGISLPNMQELGLGNLTDIRGVPALKATAGAYGKMREVSAGKDTATGHWELAGLVVETPFPTFPEGFPAEMIERFCGAVGRGVLGNKPASGTEIIEELGTEHIKSGKLILYTSADSVFQIAAHEEVVPVEELYHICEIARRMCDDYGIARVIARPFIGEPGAFQRTYNRRDYALPPPQPTVLDALSDKGVPVVGIGKIWDIYSGHGVGDNIHSEGNADGMKLALEQLDKTDKGLIFLNLVDFDMLYGHRRNPQGYSDALRDFDAFLPKLKAALGPRDLVMITADHGTDPTFRGTDHTREYVPLIAFSGDPRRSHGVDLGIRDGFYDVAQTLTDAFGLSRWQRGESILPQVIL